MKIIILIHLRIKNQTLNNDNISQASINENMDYHNKSAVINSNNYNKILNNISAIQDINQNSNNSFNYVSHNNIKNLIRDYISIKTYISKRRIKY